jgi:lipoprotein-anchoring transpeptidase ErfK/SrfK
MKQLAIVIPAACAFVFSTTVMAPPAHALETYEAKAEASDAASQAGFDMFQAFGFKHLKPGQYLWREVPESAGPERVVISIGDQLVFLYRGDALMAVATISTGRDDKPTPTGIFSVLDKKTFYRSKKYDNAPMPFMQRIDQYGIALHGGFNPGYPASHGCIRMPLTFAKKLFGLTDVGTPVMIGA